MFKQLRGTIMFKVCGDSVPEFLLNLKKNNVRYWNITYQNGYLYGETFYKNRHKVENICDKLALVYEQKNKSGIRFKSVKYKARLGIIAGTIISFFLIFLLSNSVLQIDISGNETISDDQIIAILADNGVSIGKFIPNMDLTSIERKTLVSLNELAWIGIRSSGSKIIVEIDERVKAPDLAATRIPCNIIASEDAQIVNVKVFNGQLIKIIGEGIKKGEIVVSGVYTDKFGDARYVHADAEIIGRYTDSVNFTQNFIQEESTQTGDELKRNKLDFFGIKIPLYIGDVTEKDYTYDESTSQFSIFNYKLPIGITHGNYEIYNKKTVVYSKQQVEEILNQQIKDYETNFLAEKNIISKDIEEAENDKGIKFTVNYTIEANIAQSTTILVNN